MSEKQKKAKKKGRSDGRVQVTLTVGRNADGSVKRMYFYGKNKTETNAKKKEYLQRKNQGLADEDVTVREWVELFKKLYRQNVNEAYLRNDDVPYDRLSRAIGDMYISEVREADLQNALNEVKGMSVSTIRKYYFTMKRVFEKARRNKLISDNPAEDLMIPQGTQGSHRALDRWEVDLILQNWRVHRAGLWAMLMLLCGLRRGELMGLHWDSIDLDTRLLTVREVAVLNGNSSHIEQRAKTAAGLRKIPICNQLYDALSETPESERIGLVARSAKGKQLTPRAFDRGWETFCDMLERILNDEPTDQRGIRWDLLPPEEQELRDEHRYWFRIRPHDLRHTFATGLFNAGMAPKDAQYYLGHSSIKMTMDLYTHFTEESNERAGKALVGFLDGWLGSGS